MHNSCPAPAATPQLRWGLVSKYRNQLFGFSSLWIMLMHGLQFKPISRSSLFQSWFFYPVIQVGGVGVDIFLFLSGMGLYYACQKRPKLSVFYRNRLKRILIPYLTMGLLFWGFKDLFLTQKPILFLKDLSLSTFFTRGDDTFWYISIILLMYLVAPLILRLFETRQRKTLLFLAFALCTAQSFLVALYFPTFYDFIDKALTRVFIFVLGCYFGRIIREDRPLKSRWLVYALLALTSHSLLLFLLEKCPAIPSGVVNRLWCSAAGFALCILLPVCLELLQAAPLHRFLAFLGGISLELYLSHVALKQVVKMTFPQFQKWHAAHSAAVYLCVMLGAVAVSYLFHTVQTRLTQPKQPSPSAPR